jgi:hypothetical protein
VTKALYQMAITAVRHDPVMAAHDRQLRDRRPTRVARRMLGVLNAMVRDGLTWQQTRVGQGACLPDPADAARQPTRLLRLLPLLGDCAHD